MIPTTQLAIVRAIQKKYPDCHVGGDVGLFLWGLNLDNPYYCVQMFRNTAEGMSITGFRSPFTFHYKGVMIELTIADKPYNLIMHYGYRFYVTSLEVIRQQYHSYKGQFKDTDLARIDDFCKRKGL